MSNNNQSTILTGSVPHSGFDETIMNCPICGESSGLHLDGVAVENASGQRLIAEATGEDSWARLDIHLENGITHDGRRHALSLLGRCEICGNEFRLKFRQHKGQTLFSKTVTTITDE